MSEELKYCLTCLKETKHSKEKVTPKSETRASQVTAISRVFFGLSTLGYSDFLPHVSQKHWRCLVCSKKTPR